MAYPPDLHFYSRLTEAASEFHAKGFPHWETDRLSIVLNDPNRRCSLALRHASATYEQDLGDVTLEASFVQLMVEVLPRVLKFEELTQIGYRRRYYIPVSTNYEALSRILDIKLLSQDPVQRQIHPEPKHLGFRIEFAEERKHE